MEIHQCLGRNDITNGIANASATNSLHAPTLEATPTAVACSIRGSLREGIRDGGIGIVGTRAFGILVFEGLQIDEPVLGSINANSNTGSYSIVTRCRSISIVGIARHNNTITKISNLHIFRIQAMDGVVGTTHAVVGPAVVFTVVQKNDVITQTTTSCGHIEIGLHCRRNVTDSIGAVNRVLIGIGPNSGANRKCKSIAIVGLSRAASRGVGAVGGISHRGIAETCWHAKSGGAILSNGDGRSGHVHLFEKIIVVFGRNQLVARISTRLEAI